jgi:hypothetical protein
LRFITHDWPDAYAKRILKQLRASAQTSTKLVLNDFLVPYAASSDELFSEISGSKVPTAPYPLLPNLGTVSNQTVMADLQVLVASSSIIAAADIATFQMMVATNSQERTIGQFIDLVAGTGWKLGSIGRSSKSAMCLIVFDPVAV